MGSGIRVPSPGKPQAWDMTSQCRKLILAQLAYFDAEIELSMAFGEYQLARFLSFEREELRLMLNPPTATTARRNYRKDATIRHGTKDD
jgi:hypothetical protein